MSARSFTLFELLVVLAIVTLLAGIVLPIGLSRLAADRFVQAQSQLASAVIIARADAQRRGVIVKLIAVQDDRGAALWSEELEDAGATSDVHSREGMTPRREFVLDLPSGTLFESLPASEDEVGEDGGEDARDDRPREGGEDGGGKEGATEFTLCVLMPDGTVAPGRDVLLVSGEWAARVKLNMWTGDAMFERFIRDQVDADAPPEPGEGAPASAGEGET